MKKEMIDRLEIKISRLSEEFNPKDKSSVVKKVFRNIWSRVSLKQ